MADEPMHVGVAGDSGAVVAVVRKPSADGHGDIVLRLQSASRSSGHTTDWEVSEGEALEMFLGFCVIFGLTDLVETIRALTDG